MEFVPSLPPFMYKYLDNKRKIDDKFVYLKLDVSTSVMIEKINAVLSHIDEKNKKSNFKL